MGSLLDQEPAVADRGTGPVTTRTPHLRLEGLGAGWVDGRTDVAGVDLDLPPGRRVGLVGANGSGKSTTLAVLERALDPQAGRYTVDGHDVTDLSLDAVRDLVAVVDDEPHVFAADLRANLLLARPDATDAHLTAALDVAGLGRWFEALPRASRHRSAPADAASRAASAPGSPWPAGCSPGGPWCCSTSRSPTSTPRRPGASCATSRRPSRGVPWWSSATAPKDSSRSTRSSTSPPPARTSLCQPLPPPLVSATSSAPSWRRLWDSTKSRPDGASVREVLEALPSERGLAYTTVMTVLDRLSKKGLVTRERDGRAWRYTPAGTRESLTAETMRASLGDVTDRRAALLHFLDGATSEEPRRPARSPVRGGAAARLRPDQRRCTPSFWRSSRSSSPASRPG